jgi:poly(3-hydroxyalkanoate) synthetase
MAERPILWSSLLFPFAVATRFGEATLHAVGTALGDAAAPSERHEAPPWTTANELRLELKTMRLRLFSPIGPSDVPVVVVTPLALHGALVADLAPGHSLVERLLAEGVAPLALTECRSATPDMRYLGIDDYLADLGVAIDDLGGRAHLIGLCQGGWLALMLAARFPDKVASLVLAGAPVDLDAAPSRLVEAARAFAPGWIDGLVETGNGLVLGDEMRALWDRDRLDPGEIARLLQVTPPASETLCKRFAAWDAFTLDLPGVYYRETVEKLFQRNALARGAFRALGRMLALKRVTVPLTVLAGSADDVVPPEQALAAARLVGTAERQVVCHLVEATHLGLFMGARVLDGPWREIAVGLRRHRTPGRRIQPTRTRRRPQR